MPRYFFDIRDQNGVHFDETGLVLPDVTAARTEARRALGEIIKEDFVKKGRGAVTIDIRAGDGEFVVEVVGAVDDRDRRRDAPNLR